MIKDKFAVSLRYDRIIATLLVLILCVQFVALEGFGVSKIKVAIMAISPLIILIRVPYVTKALLWGLVYWLTCYFVASFHGDMRFSTLGYLGLFLSSFIAYYGLLQKGVFSITSFKRFLEILIKVFAIVLVLQQICMLVGIHNMPIINLANQQSLAIDKLPILTQEPSSSARILAVAMLCYLRCLELLGGRIRPTVIQLFNVENRWVTISFLYCMFTMGSGTAYIALGLLSIYFINKRNLLYLLPLVIGLFFLGNSIEIRNFERAKITLEATMSGDNQTIAEADGSAALRIVPLINTIKMDPFDEDNWFGKGTKAKDEYKKWWKYAETKISIVDQYGIIGLIASLILLFTCIIRRFLSIEMLMFVILFGLTLGNIAYVWGAMFMFATIRYFQVKNENGTIV